MNWVGHLVAQYLVELRESPTAEKQARIHANLMYWRERVFAEGDVTLKDDWNRCLRLSGGSVEDLILFLKVPLSHQ